MTRTATTDQFADHPLAENFAPLEWSCTCPRAGFCKHVVALLLTRIDHPSKLVVRPELSETL